MFTLSLVVLVIVGLLILTSLPELEQDPIRRNIVPFAVARLVRLKLARIAGRMLIANNQKVLAQ